MAEVEDLLKVTPGLEEAQLGEDADVLELDGLVMDAMDQVQARLHLPRRHGLERAAVSPSEEEGLLCGRPWPETGFAIDSLARAKQGSVGTPWGEVVWPCVRRLCVIELRLVLEIGECVGKDLVADLGRDGREKRAL